MTLNLTLKLDPRPKKNLKMLISALFDSKLMQTAARFSHDE